MREGEVIAAINGVPTLSVPHPGALLRHLTGRQVLLRITDPAGGEEREVIVEPISLAEERDLRYHEWELTRRLETEKLGNGAIGYVHLRAMGSSNYTEWAKGFYPVFDRQALIQKTSPLFNKSIMGTGGRQPF